MNTAVLGMAPKGRQKRPADVAELDNRQRLQLDAAQSPETVRGDGGWGGGGERGAERKGGGNRIKKIP